MVPRASELHGHVARAVTQGPALGLMHYHQHLGIINHF